MLGTRNFATLVLLLAILPVFTAAGQSYRLDEESKLWIDGTSNRSDWTVYAKEMSATAEGASDALAPTTLTMTVSAADIKSDKSTIMDRLMHETLQVTEHPTITFELVEAVPTSGNVLTSRGRLTLTGVTKDVEMTVEGERLSDGSVRFTGSTPLKLSDYGMQPPTAMFGALRTADDVMIQFDVTLVPAG